MARSSDIDITRLLAAWSHGAAEARDQLMPIVYSELRRRAAAYLRCEPRGRTLRPTELVHETYLRLCAQNAGWKNREQFFAVAAQLMRTARHLVRASGGDPACRCRRDRDRQGARGSGRARRARS